MRRRRGVPELYQDDIYQPYFEMLRREDPVHFCEDSHFGPMVGDPIQGHHGGGGEPPGVLLALGTRRRQAGRPGEGHERPSFIQMDEPDHGERRKAVSPVVAPGNLARMEGMIRERTNMVLDGRSRGETFDWVNRSRSN